MTTSSCGEVSTASPKVLFFKHLYCVPDYSSYVPPKQVPDPSEPIDVLLWPGVRTDDHTDTFEAEVQTFFRLVFEKTGAKARNLTTIDVSVDVQTQLQNFFKSTNNRKAIFYVGHGEGGCGSFCFDVAAGSIPFDCTSEDEGNQDTIESAIRGRYVFAQDIVSAAGQSNTTVVHLFVCSCNGLAAGGAMQLSSSASKTQFYVRMAGLEVSMSDFDELGWVSVSPQLEQTFQSVMEQFKNYCAVPGNTAMLLSVDDLNINVCYTNNIRELLASSGVSDSDKLKWTKEKKQLAKYWEMVKTARHINCNGMRDKAIEWTIKDQDGDFRDFVLHGHTIPHNKGGHVLKLFHVKTSREVRGEQNRLSVAPEGVILRNLYATARQAGVDTLDCLSTAP